MSATSTLTNFLFVDRQSGRVVGTKVCRDQDFALQSKDYHTFLVRGEWRCPRLPAFGYSYDPTDGLKEIATPNRQEFERLKLLSEKIEISILILACAFMTRQGIASAYGPASPVHEAVDGAAFHKYWIFMNEELQVVLNKINVSIDGLLRQIDGATDKKQVDEIFLNLRINRSLAFMTDHRTSNDWQLLLHEIGGR